MFRAAFVMWFILGFGLGFWAGATWDEPVDNTRSVTTYKVTPHVLRYYEALRISHYPAPDAYVRGKAGRDYCFNLASWYVSISRDITNEPDTRTEIKNAYLAQLDYEVAHDWLMRSDANRLSEWIAKAPPGISGKYLAQIAYDSCQAREPV